MRLHRPAALRKPTAGHRVASRGQASTRLEARVLRAGETHLEVQLLASWYAAKRRKEGK
jgi:hypothetical protein